LTQIRSRSQLWITLHNEEMRIVYIELHRMKEIGHLASRSVSSIDQVLALSSQENLTSHCNLGTLLVSNGTSSFLLIVKDDSDTGLVDTSLTLLVDKLGKISCSHLTQVCNAKNKADGVKNIRLSRTIEASNGVEMRVESGVLNATRVEFSCENNDIDCDAKGPHKIRKARSNPTTDSPSNHCPSSVRLEAINDNLLNVHCKSERGCAAPMIPLVSCNEKLFRRFSFSVVT
jgi:hypothetical protein